MISAVMRAYDPPGTRSRASMHSLVLVGWLLQLFSEVLHKVKVSFGETHIGIEHLWRSYERTSKPLMLELLEPISGPWTLAVRDLALRTNDSGLYLLHTKYLFWMISAVMRADMTTRHQISSINAELILVGWLLQLFSEVLHKVKVSFGETHIGIKHLWRSYNQKKFFFSIDRITRFPKRAKIYSTV